MNEKHKDNYTKKHSPKCLLICTQSVDQNDPVAGFFAAWVQEFSKHCEKVTAIALDGTGAENFTENVNVISLEKEKSATKLRQLYLFYRAIIKHRNDYDTVFVHNVGPKIVILGAPFWIIFHKRIFLWYVHRQVTLSLKIAVRIVKRIFTSAPESLQVNTDKVMYVGHGIPLDKFDSINPITSHSPMKVVHLGRIAPIKGLDVLVEASYLLKKEFSTEYEFHLYGTSVNESEQSFQNLLKEKIEQYNLTNQFYFHGTVPPYEVPDIFKNATVSVNLTPTGGMDKSVIESLAAGVPALTSNDAYSDTFGDLKEQLIFEYKDPKSLVEKLEALRNLSESDFKQLQTKVRVIANKFDLPKLIQRLTNEMYHDMISKIE